MKSKNQLIKIFLTFFFSYAIIACGACDDRIKYIDAWGRIIAKDSCSLNGRTAWIVDLDMSRTRVPRADMVLPIHKDTINGIRYNGLVRVFCNIQEADTIIFTKEFNLRMKPLTTSCPSSSYDFSSYNAYDDYYYTM
jgi:hypothetical protein